MILLKRSYQVQNKVWLLAALALASCSSSKNADSSDELSMDEMSADGELQLGNTKRAALPDGVDFANYKGAHFPKIADTPFKKNGYWMNAYHFIRANESWEDVSRLIYDRSDRASLIAAWNPDVALKAGALVYYNSPFRADDSSEMKNLAADFGIPTERVVVQKGNWLSTIAGERYGSVEGWREIASLNRDKLSSPDKIEVGQELEVLPVQLNTKPILRAFVERAKEVAQGAQVAGSVQDGGDDQGLSDQENKDLEGELDKAAASGDSAKAAPGESLALGGGASIVSRAKDFLLAHLSNLLLLLAVSCGLGAGIYLLRTRKGKFKSTNKNKTNLGEKEITLNMDILDKTGTSHTGVTSRHTLN